MCHALIKFWFLKIVPTEINPIQDKFVCKKRQVHFNPHNLAAPKLIVESEKTPLNLKATNLTPSNSQNWTNTRLHYLKVVLLAVVAYGPHMSVHMAVGSTYQYHLSLLALLLSLHLSFLSAAVAPSAAHLPPSAHGRTRETRNPS